MNNTPRIRFAGFEGDWEKNKFNSIFAILKNNTFSRAELTDTDGFALNIHYGDILIKFGEVLDLETETLPFIESAQTAKKFESSYLHNGDIIVADTAEDETAGKSTEIMNLGEIPVISGLHTIPLRPKEDFAEGYLGYYLNSDAYHDTLLPLLQGTKVLSISKTALQGTRVCYPTECDEQARIGNYFRNLDSLITLYEREHEKLIALKAACLDKMFPKNGSKVPEIRYEFTGDWEHHRLGDVGKTYTGLSGKTKIDFGHGEGKFITYMNVFANPVSSLLGVEPIEIDDSQNEVQIGDVFFTTSSETPEEVGMSSVLIEKKGIVYLNSFCFGFRPSVRFDPYYLAYMLRSNYVRKQIVFLAQGISRYNISKTKMMDIHIPVPSLEEQKKVGQYFKGLDDLISLQHNKVKKLKQLKQALLNDMFV
ncbi:MAG: restriction endonuclease subunit S [Oscillospiraceae bacterium]|nr:restriction endonuclease subunit S [Oscillospiraceae bacterium]